MLLPVPYLLEHYRSVMLAERERRRARIRNRTLAAVLVIAATAAFFVL